MPALTKAQKKQATAAEDTFNRTYAAQYGEERWTRSLHPALTAPTRYALLINQYATNNIAGLLTQDEVEKLEAVTFPRYKASSVESQLAAYQRRPSESQTRFPSPQPNLSKGLVTHWNLDAASLLAVTILNPKPGDKILDLCASPGGKSVAIAQLLRPEGFVDALPSLSGGILQSNEFNHARNKRLVTNLQQYLPKQFFASHEVKVLKLDAAEPNAAQMLPLGLGGYDKVLLDAPCSSERHVIQAHCKAKQGGRVGDEMASWRSSQSKKIAKTQVALLMTALKAVRVGGFILYATCSLSNEENDGVIKKGLELVQKERKNYGITWGMAVRSGDLAMHGIDQWAETTTYGWIVLPDHPSEGRWGPLFFAILEKVNI